MMAMAAICQQTHDYGGLIINILYMPAVIEAVTVHISQQAAALVTYSVTYVWPTNLLYIIN